MLGRLRSSVVFFLVEIVCSFCSLCTVVSGSLQYFLSLFYVFCRRRDYDNILKTSLKCNISASGTQPNIHFCQDKTLLTRIPNKPTVATEASRVVHRISVTLQFSEIRSVTPSLLKSKVHKNESISLRSIIKSEIHVLLSETYTRTKNEHLLLLILQSFLQNRELNKSLKLRLVKTGTKSCSI